jgi:hypothetical protein
MKLKPFNITDLRNKDNEDNKRSNSFILKNHKKKFFNIQIKIPGIGGKERIMKIYLDDDIKNNVDTFCKIYNIKENIKEKLTKVIIDLRNDYLEKNKNIIF